MESTILYNEALKIALLRNRLSQRELARKAHIPEAYISLAINGKMNLSPQKQMRIAEILGADINALFGNKAEVCANG